MPIYVDTLAIDSLVLLSIELELQELIPGIELGQTVYASNIIPRARLCNLLISLHLKYALSSGMQITSLY